MFVWGKKVISYVNQLAVCVFLTKAPIGKKGHEKPNITMVTVYSPPPFKDI